MEPSWTDPSKVSVVLTRATGDAPAQTHSPQPQTARAIVSSFPARRFDGPFACLLTLCGTWFDGPRRAASGWIVPNGDSGRIEFGGFQFT